MDEKDLALIKELLTQCLESLVDDTICPSQKVAFFVMVRVNQLAQEACGIANVALSKVDVATLKTSIISALGITYDDCHRVEFYELLYAEKESQWDSLQDACAILSKCAYLKDSSMEDCGASVLYSAIKDTSKVLKFAEHLDKVHTDYANLISKLYEVG